MFRNECVHVLELSGVPIVVARIEICLKTYIAVYNLPSGSTKECQASTHTKAIKEPKPSHQPNQSRHQIHVD